MARKEHWHPFWLAESCTWAVDFRVAGRRIRRRLPIQDLSLRKVAVAMAKQIHHDTWQEMLSPTLEPRGTTFAEAARLYVKQGGEERYLSRIISHFGADVLVGEIDEIMIANAAEAIYGSAKSETVRRQLRVPIKAVQNFAAGKRRQQVTDTVRLRWLTPEEAERLLDAASAPAAADLRDPNLHTLRKIAFMLGTGAGPGETMSLPAEGWNASTKQWWLPGTKTIYRARFVHPPTRTIDLIGEVPLCGRAFLAPNGQPYIMADDRGGQMAEAFNKVRKAAGLNDDVVPYTLRHTWATWFYAQTKDWGALLDNGGWNRADTANRYRKIAPADLGNKLLAHGWDFRRHPGQPVRFGEYVSVRFPPNNQGDQ